MRLDPRSASIGIGLGLVGIGLAALLLASRSSAGHNFILIIADDVGVDRVQAYAPYVYPAPPPSQTPEIDRLASEGILFTRAWATPFCSPTRAALLTGKHPFRTGHGSNSQRLLKQGNPSLDVGRHATIPQMLDRIADYESHAVGKWHVAGFVPGPDGNPVLDQQHPIAAGFDSFEGTLFNIVGPNESYGGYAEPEGSPPWAPYIGFHGWSKLEVSRSIPAVSFITKTYATRETADEAIRRIATAQEPWFLWVAFNAGHLPFHVPPSNLSAGLGDPGPELLDPGSAYSLSTTFADPTAPTAPEMNRAMVEAMDHEIGRIVAAADAASAAGELEHPVTIFIIGDNGTPPSAVDGPFDPDRAKGKLYETGVRVPFIVRSPQIDAERVGDTEDALVNVTDVWRTIGDLAGADFGDPNSFGPDDGTDSISLTKFFDADPANDDRRTVNYAEKFKPIGTAPDGGDLPRTSYDRAVRNETHKLFRRAGLYTELYALEDPNSLAPQDPAEAENLFCSLPLEGAALEAFDELRAAMESVDNDPDCQGEPGEDDLDRDGVCDREDVCVFRTNPVDSDGDGLGNECDFDYDNDGVVGFLDYKILRSSFGLSLGQPGYLPETDTDQDDVIGSRDFLLFRQAMYTTVEQFGPSGPYSDTNGDRIHDAPPNCP